MRRKALITAGLAALLIAAALPSYLIWEKGKSQQQALEQELKELRVMEKRATVVKGVSKRMEEIAFHQKLISDERREEAISQARIAEEKTREAEAERERAQHAEHVATASEHTARQAYETAEWQRLEAEYAKRVADTLNARTLSHSLGLRAQSLYLAGERDLAALLSHSAYQMAVENGGDPYSASIYDALVMTSQSMITKSMKNAETPGICYMTGSNDKVLTVNILGEIFEHKTNGSSISSRNVYRNNRMRFADLYVTSDGTAYALSLTGDLVVLKGSEAKVIPIEAIKKPTYLAQMNNENQLLIVGEGSMAVFDKKSATVTDSRQTDFLVSCVSRVDGKPLIFDRQGRMHLVESLSRLITSKTPVKGIVTAFARSNLTGTTAYGTSDGTIYCLTPTGGTIQLVGHRSKVTKLKMDRESLYSSSLDGTLNRWVLTTNKPEPLTLINTKQWILNFDLDKQRDHIWATTANGQLIEHLISADLLAQMVKRNIKRDFTQEEWDYYVGIQKSKR